MHLVVEPQCRPGLPGVLRPMAAIRAFGNFRWAARRRFGIGAGRRGCRRVPAAVAGESRPKFQNFGNGVMCPMGGLPLAGVSSPSGRRGRPLPIPPRAEAGFEDLDAMAGQDLGESAMQALDGMNSGASQIAGSAVEAASAALGSATESVGSFLDSIAGATGSALSGAADAVDSTVRGAQEAAGSAAAAAGERVGAVGQGIVDAAPEPVRGALEAFAGNPGGFSVLLAAVVGIPTLLYLVDRYGGYAGALSAEEVMEELQAVQPALLVDIRSDAEREASGIPKLKQKALGKGVAVPMCAISQGLQKRVADPGKLRAALTAAYIGGLRQATYATKYIIMGGKERDEREVAKALRTLQYPFAYTMEGGYDAWQAGGLPCLTGERAVYDSGTMVVAEMMSAEAANLRDPRVLAPALAGGAALVAVVINYHFVLQLVGVLGPLATLGFFLARRYEDPNDLWKDMTSVYGAAAGTIGGVAEKAKSSILEQSEARAGETFPFQAPSDVSIPGLAGLMGSPDAETRAQDDGDAGKRSSMPKQPQESNDAYDL